MVTLTKAMLKDAVADGAEVADIKKPRKVQKPPPPKPAPLPAKPDNSAEIAALRNEISLLKQALQAAKNSSETRSQELTALVSGMSKNEPLRLKPVRDMNRDSPTYLLVEYYDFIPVTYKKRKLDS